MGCPAAPLTLSNSVKGRVPVGDREKVLGDHHHKRNENYSEEDFPEREGQESLSSVDSDGQVTHSRGASTAS